MKPILILSVEIILLVLTFFSFQIQENEVVGTYISVKSEFEQHSTLILDENNRFIYSYGIGGCNGEITGLWLKKKGKHLEFISDEEFRNIPQTLLGESDSLLAKFNLLSMRPCYPDLNKGNWVLTNRGIQLNKQMECSCWPVKGLHKKDK